MELELFNFVKSTMTLYDSNMSYYQKAEAILKDCYKEITTDVNTGVVDIYTRIKSRDSLQEKLLRNKYYLEFNTAEEALDYMPDIIGITIECQFIRNEDQLYKKLFYYFDSNNSSFSKCHLDHDNYLNLHMLQPQMQRNGFTIYRIDGYYMLQGKKINYELQIKSLVHRFWSDIEHSVVYKNPDFVAYNNFLKTMLSTVRDNLDVVDRQLEIIYSEISSSSHKVQIGMDPDNFKMMIAASITELVNRKMKDTIGFTTDFKYNASILAQYIYINDFLNSENTKMKMVDYLEHLNLLSASDLDFKSPIFMEDGFYPNSIFAKVIGEYWLSIMNIDFEWHVFFVMLFAIEPGNSTEDFSNFIRVIKDLLILPSWYETKFINFNDNKETVKEIFEEILAESLVNIKTTKMIHEEKLFMAMNAFKLTVEESEKKYSSLTDIISNRDNIAMILQRRMNEKVAIK